VALIAPEQSALLKRYNALMTMGKVGCLALALLAGGWTFSKLAWAKSEMSAEGAIRTGRGERRAMIIVLGATVIVGGALGLMGYGALTMTLEPMKKKMLWSIYKVEGEQRTLKATGLTHDEAQTRKSQMENRELGAVFEAVPE
jgi:hypothetical protein